MKNLITVFLFIFCAISFGQKSKVWNEIDSLLRFNQYETAEGRLDSFSKTVESKVSVNQLLEQFYRFKLINDYSTNKYVNTIKNLESKLTLAKYPEKALFESFLAQVYENYWNRNQRLITGRATNLKNSTFEKWSSVEFKQVIDSLYESSISEEGILTKTSVSNYSNFLDDTTFLEVTPTLYELLAERALKYYQRSYKVSSGFILNDSLNYAPRNVFVHKNITTSDSSNYGYKGVVLLQKLIKKHLLDKDQSVVIYWDLKRTQFVHEYSVLRNNMMFYHNALSKLYHVDSHNPYAGYVAFTLAKELETLGELYTTNYDSSYVFKIRDALSICNWVMVQGYDSTSIGVRNCIGLKSKILSKELNLDIEKNIMPHKKSLVKVSFKNVDKIYIRLIKTSRDERNKVNLISRPYFSSSTDEVVGYYKYKDPQYISSFKLPKAEDYQEHHTEVVVKGLPVGDYVLLVGTREDLSADNGHVVGFSNIKVTNIAYQTRQDERRLEVLAYHRVTGLPLEGAIIQAYNDTYDADAKKYVKKVGTKYITGEGGNIYMYNTENTDFGNTQFKISYKKDTLFSDKFYLSKSRKESKDSIIKVNLYTDRLLYKPGQKVYFKGIVYKGRDAAYNACKDFNQTIELINSNYVTIDSLNLVTNDFGSFSGEFLIPENQLPGEFIIYTEYKSVKIQVEQFNRPSFFVELERSKKPVILNEQMSINGKALTYSGVPEKNAKVIYTIKRRVLKFERRNFEKKEREQLIFGGNAITNQNGEFFIDFNLDPDLNYLPEEHPEFEFLIGVKVVNAKGETQEVNASYDVSYNSKIISFDWANRVNRNNGDLELSFAYSDWNDIQLDGDVRVQVYRLAEPEKAYLDRLWTIPELKTLPKKSFDKWFPHFAYNREDKLDQWTKEELILDSLTKKGERGIKLSELKKWKTGGYVVSFLVDSVEQKLFHFALYDSKSSSLPFPTVFWTNCSSRRVNVGEKLFVGVGTSVKGKALVEVELRGQIIQRKWVNLKREKKQIPVLIKEEHQGGLKVYVSFFYNNRSFNKVYDIEVPVKGKELDLKLVTSKDVTEPGVSETWEVQISQDSSIVSDAELMLSVYDKSLDGIMGKPNKYGLNLYQFNYPSHLWRTFGANQLARFAEMGGKKRSYSFETLSEPEFLYSFDLIAAPMVLKASNNEVIPQKRYRHLDLRKSRNNLSPTEVRQDFRETACFYPNVTSNSKGRYSFSFFVPDQLTTWSLIGLAHTENGEIGSLEHEFSVKKELIVNSNKLRFLRVGDTLNYSVTVDNLSNKDLNAQVQISIIDAVTNKDITGLFIQEETLKTVPIKTRGASKIDWALTAQENVYAIEVVVSAETNQHRDVEKVRLPILSQYEMVTDQLSILIDQPGKYSYSMKSKDIDVENSRKVVFEYTSNPYWYAILALPSLVESNNSSSYQVYTSFYTNFISRYVYRSNPRIKQILKHWDKDKETITQSFFDKNKRIAEAVYEETPWVFEIQNDQARKKNLINLFEEERVEKGIQNVWGRLISKQLPNGGFEWFDGLGADPVVTTEVITGLGELSLMDTTLKFLPSYNNLMRLGTDYLSNQLIANYMKLLSLEKEDSLVLQKNNLNYVVVDYFHLRSIIGEDLGGDELLKEAYSYYKNQSQRFWMEQPIAQQIKLVHYFLSVQNNELADLIFKGLSESLTKTKYGAYFNQGGHPKSLKITAQFLELCNKIDVNNEVSESLLVYLLYNKKTNDWGHDIVTSEVVHAILMNNTNWAVTNDVPSVRIGNNVIDPKKDSIVGLEAGTGYFMVNYKEDQINSEMMNVSVENESNSVSFGSMYWMYEKPVSEIKAASNDIIVQKSILRKTNSGLTEEPKSIMVGDKLLVRMELEVATDVSYVELRDQRSSCFEPVSTKSQVVIQSGVPSYLTYNNSTTIFYIDRLTKGKHVFEYEVYVTNSGQYESGITKVVSMYSPDKEGRAKSIKFNVKK